MRLISLVAIVYVVAAFETNGVDARGIGESLPLQTASVWDGVYTEEQATRGRSTFVAESCAQCHGDALAGAEFGPALVGKEFVSGWADLTLGDLFERVKNTMPQDNPGHLSARQAADLVSYLLKANDFPAGGTGLPGDLAVLKNIKIEPRKAGRPQ